MISSEVQRTLVKSPPELWAEISDPEALARHLGEFGEIRITRVQPEQKVEWEAPDASGSIVIKPSGWGTKVKLTVTRELSEVASKLEPDSGEESEPGEELEPEGREILAGEHLADEQAAESPLAEEQLEEAEDEIAASSPLEADDDQRDDDPLPPPSGISDPSAQCEPEPEPARRLGFFARLFGRRRGARPATEETDVQTPEIAEDVEEHPEPTLVADRAGASDQAITLAAEVALVETELDAEPEPTPATPPAAELERAEEAAEEQVTAVLTGVLDRLGAAHHRPFSRA
jgi:hypothetical protein